MTDRQRKEAAYHRRKPGETLYDANGQAGKFVKMQRFIIESKTCPKISAERWCPPFQRPTNFCLQMYERTEYNSSEISVCEITDPS
jgi:hypothetical protein